MAFLIIHRKRAVSWDRLGGGRGHTLGEVGVIHWGRPGDDKVRGVHALVPQANKQNGVGPQMIAVANMQTESNFTCKNKKLLSQFGGRKEAL